VSGVDRLIVGTSGSPGSLQALRYAEGMARAHGAVLIPVLAWELPGGDYGERVHPSGELRQVWRNLACQRLRDALIAVWGKVPDDPLLQPHVERGPAGWVLVNLACHPGDVLVVGAGRRGALARMAFPRWAAIAWPTLGARSWPYRRPTLPANSRIAAWRGCSGTGH
jgi:nucleotide-binding universal stress UspA family protein